MKSGTAIIRRGLRALRKIVRNEDGSNLVEMGLSMIVFMPFFFAVIQFSYGLYVYNYVGEAAREATRWAAVRGSTCYSDLGSSFCPSNGSSDTDIQSYVQGMGFPGMNKSSISVATNWYTASSGTPRTWSLCSSGIPACNKPGNQVQIAVSYPVPLPIPFWKSLTLTVKSTSQMVIVQ
jgi:Flp pilus assembly protein TadG